MTDVLIIGGGPAGLTAAIYARRAGLSVTLLERMTTGGQMAATPEVDNYPGIPHTAGMDLAVTMEQHARAHGTEIQYAEVTALAVENGTLTATTSAGKLHARSVIAALGVKRRTIGCPGEDSFFGRGVSYCATCDGGFFKGKAVAVIGGGNTALEDALYLAGLGCTVHLVHRRDQFRGGKFLEEQVRKQANILLELEQVPTAINGTLKVESLTVQNVKTGVCKDIPLAGVFVAVGVLPQTDLLKDLLTLSDTGHVLAGEDCLTPVAGLFVAGDIRQKPLYQIVTACADGAVAAGAAGQFLTSQSV